MAATQSIRTPQPSRGKVYLVGAGPGDPGMLTLRGAECLGMADDVLYDYLVNPQLLQWAPRAKHVCLGKHGRTRIWTQEEINAELIALALRGRVVVRLKGGDPIVFARGAEETEALQGAGIAIEIVPGITAGLAAGSFAGIPLTHRDFASAVALVAAHRSDVSASAMDYAALARFPGTLVFYMGVTTAPQWTSHLMAAGMPPETPAALVRRCSLPDQWTWTGRLDEVAPLLQRTATRPPVIALVGQAARQQAALRWFENRRLFGVRVLITRPAGQADALAQPLAELGASILTHPVVSIGELEDWGPLDRELQRLDAFDWIVFSSVNGVDAFFDRLHQRGEDARRLARSQLAVVGDATAERLRQRGLKPDLQPERFDSESVADALAPAAKGQKCLLIRASRGREVLAERLAAAGADVTTVVAYRNEDVTAPDPDIARQIDGGEVDWITVTSPAIARNLFQLFGAALQKSRLASISPLTTAALQSCGLRVAAEAETYNMPGLARALVEAHERRPAAAGDA